MILKKRLIICSEFVKENSVVADVGTDHGYLPVYLIKNNISKKAFACDINEKPLYSAKKTVKDNNLEDKIELVLSDGLKNVDFKDITDVVIAGMGGELISKILSECDWIKNGINLVLQPMTKHDSLRKWLYKNGFKILKEKVVAEDSFIYTIINATYCGKNVGIDDYFSITGYVDEKTNNGKLYYEKLLQKYIRIVSNIKQVDSMKQEMKNMNDIILKLQKALEVNDEKSY